MNPLGIGMYEFTLRLFNFASLVATTGCKLRQVFLNEQLPQHFCDNLAE